MRIILSIGFGRLHLVQTAQWLARAGAPVDLIGGWVPKSADSWIVRLCSKICGHNLVPGLKKRQIELVKGTVHSQACLEFLAQFLFLADRFLFRSRLHWSFARFSWRMFGWGSKRYIRNSSDGVTVGRVLHVRSGAGQGGAIAKARSLGMPVIVDHSIAHPDFMAREVSPVFASSFWRMVRKDCYEADILLVNSYFVRDTFVAEGYPVEKIRVAYLGVRSDFMGLRKSKLKGRNTKIPLKLLFTGGFGVRKGGEFILEALHMVNEFRPGSFTMDFVGSYERSIVDRFAQYSLPIKFHGPVPQDDLKQYLANSDVYVFPSLAEGCASSGMEALAAGMCVVATRESGFPISDGVDGYVVPAKNAQAVADRILYLMDHPDDIDRTGAAAAELIRNNYTWEKYAENLKSIYTEMLEKKNG